MEEKVDVGKLEMTLEMLIKLVAEGTSIRIVIDSLRVQESGDAAGVIEGPSTGEKTFVEVRFLSG